MFMVMILHVNLNGSQMIKGSLQNPSVQASVWIEFICIIAVNLFAMISGYVGLNSRHRYSRLVELWLQVIFYSWLSLFIAELLGINVYKFQLIKSIFPAVFMQYWYFNAYLLLFILMPILNVGIKTLSRRKLTLLCILSFVAVSFLNIVRTTNGFGIAYGYTTIWLSLMYIYGALLRIYGLPKFLSQKKYCLALWAVSFIVLVIGANVLALFSGHRLNLRLIAYNNPLTVIRLQYSVSFFKFMLMKVKCDVLLQK